MKGYISSLVAVIIRLTHVLECVHLLNLSNSDIKRIPDCILPSSLWRLNAADCGSLKSVSFSFYENYCVQSEKEAIRVSSFFNHPTREVLFRNCTKLDEEARRLLIQGWDFMKVVLPGKEIPGEFTHIAKGHSITISSGILSASSSFKACILLSPALPIKTVNRIHIIHCRLRSKGLLINELRFSEHYRPPCPQFLTEQLFVFSGRLFKEYLDDATTSEIQFEVSCRDIDKIVECGVQIFSSNSSRKCKEHNDGVILGL
ncbi:unnamed protein product [Microthlaspi erraticum]|uniref:FBD domain-containing protein n=1 Tax=Microthlaspi erraticum TaxID=1685480 RepID=A0A6D2HII0_9BRAS|nr:unnamed protein product [Microthlaspi erraticum]